MTDTAVKLAEHYRKLAAEEVAMAKVALTNEARARHYAKAADYGRSAGQAIRLRVKRPGCKGRGVDARPNWKQMHPCAEAAVLIEPAQLGAVPNKYGCGA